MLTTFDYDNYTDKFTNEKKMGILAEKKFS